MPIPDPVRRERIHTRKVAYVGYKREDGLWDIEGELKDTKDHPMTLPDGTVIPPEAAIHAMAIRVTVDDTMTVKDISTSMSSTPFVECKLASNPLKSMIGAKMGPGWRKVIDANLGGIKSCTHLRELLYNMATAAYQVIPNYQRQMEIEAGQISQRSKPPFHLGKCLAWDFDGSVVQRFEPNFFQWGKRDAKPKL